MLLTVTALEDTIVSDTVEYSLTAGSEPSENTMVRMDQQSYITIDVKNSEFLEDLNFGLDDTDSSGTTFKVAASLMLSLLTVSMMA